MKHIMIISGEASGELYGALLAVELRKRLHGLLITGVGGDKMEKAGVKLISRISGAMGFTEAFSSLKHLIKTYFLIKDILKGKGVSRPDLIVLIDFPDFNLKVAKTAKSMGIKVLYYVSPQVWAWRGGRIKKIAARSDNIAVILPFEEEIYRNAKIPCRFVGHPVMEEMRGLSLDPVNFKKEFSIDTNHPVCALLPGSRHSEIERHLPIIEESAAILMERHPDVQFIMALASSIDWTHNSIIKRLKEMGVIMVSGRAVEALSVSDIALVASGTATLQTALLGIPMVVFYKVSPLSFFLVKYIMTVKHVSLPNILAGRQIVPELLQERMNAKELVSAFEEIFNDKDKLEAMAVSLISIKEEFKDKNPSIEVAGMICDMLGVTCNI